MANKINPLSYVVDTTPVPEAVIDASGWFQTETMTYVPKSTEADLLPWYLAQGWTLLPNSTQTTASSPYWVWLDGIAPASGTPVPSYAEQGFAIYSVTLIVGTGVQQQTFRGQYQVTAYHTTVHNLTRRKLQAEAALQDLITDFTGAYNEGRSINDQRYDEILTIHNVMLDETEDELAAATTLADNYKANVDSIIALLLADFETYSDDVDTQLTDFGTSERARVNTQFDSQSSDVNNRLVSNGLYNTTVWATLSTGVEEARARALTEVNDSIKARTLASEQIVYNAQVAMRNGMMAAYERVTLIGSDDAKAAIEGRNHILTAMLGFMERRVDSYPGLENLSAIAASIGFTDTGAIVKP